MSSDYDRSVKELVMRLIPLSKKRITIALDHSREDVEEEMATLADLFVIADHIPD